MRFSKKKLLFVVLGIILITTITTICLFAFVPRYKKLTAFEEASFDSQSTKIMNFFELIDTEENIDLEYKYISYAAEYLYADSGKKSYSLDEIQEVIDNNFSDYKDIKSYLSDKENIYIPESQTEYNGESHQIEIKKDELTHKEIIHTPITKYIKTSVQKKGDTFKATYDKYVFDDPYDIIDRTSQDDFEGEHSVKDYLDGPGTNLALKERLNATNAPDIAEPQKQITVYFVLHNDQIIVANYES